MDITFFDTYEEMVEAELKARAEADKRVQDWQAEIKPGECFANPTPYGFNVYGVVLHGYKREYLKHYRYCNCYSVACPEGERGDVHISTMGTLIDRETFKQVKEKLRDREDV